MRVCPKRGYPFGSERQFHNPSLMQHFEVHWNHPRSVDKWLKKISIEPTLNVCSGKSDVGDVKIDVMRELKPTIVADMHNLPFADKTFNTVICDPPFDYYGSLKWLHELRRLAFRRVIIASNLRRIGLGKGWKVQFFVSRHKATMMMKFWQVFTYANQSRLLEVSE